MNQAGRDLAGISEVFAEADEEIGPVAKAAVGVMDAIGWCPASDDDVISPVRVHDHRPVSRQAALQLQQSIAYVRDHVMAGPERARTPLVLSAAMTVTDVAYC